MLPFTRLLHAQQRVEVAEARQNQVMAFLSKALQNPGMLQQLVSSRQNIGRLENGGDSGRTRASSLFRHRGLLVDVHMTGPGSIREVAPPAVSIVCCGSCSTCQSESLRRLDETRKPHFAAHP